MRCTQSLRAAAPEWGGEKWVTADNLHATVSFLGEVPTSGLHQLSSSMDSQLGSIAPFSLRFGGLQAIPHPSRCRMIWASFSDDHDSFRGLCTAVAGSAFQALGRPPHRPSVKPHVTLCRARGVRTLSDVALTGASVALTSDDTFMSVLSVTLFSSRLTKRGPVYEVLESWPLGGNDDDRCVPR